MKPANKVNKDFRVYADLVDPMVNRVDLVSKVLPVTRVIQAAQV